MSGEGKTIRRYYPLWQVARLEAMLEQEAAKGWQLKSAGRFRYDFVPAPGKAGHCRVGGLEGKTGTASRMQSLLFWQRARWELLCQCGQLGFFRATDAEPPEDKAFADLLARAIRWRERLRGLMLVLAALCLVAGYMAEGFLITRLAAVPLAVALALSYVIGKLQKVKR